MILWRRYKWIETVLKHFDKEYERCQSTLKCFATEYNYIIRSSHQRCSVRKMFLEISQNSRENTCARVSFLIKLQVEVRCNFIKKENLALVFFYEFCKISKNTFFTEHLLATAFLSITTKLRKDLFPMKITICGMGTDFLNISRYLHFQAMVFL